DPFADSARRDAESIRGRNQDGHWGECGSISEIRRVASRVAEIATEVRPRFRWGSVAVAFPGEAGQVARHRWRPRGGETVRDRWRRLHGVTGRLLHRETYGGWRR